MPDTKRQSPDPVIEEYRRLAPVYDSKWAFYVEATHRETLARLSLQPTDRVLDVGCGTGVLLATLAHRYPRATLVGIDPVAEMLAAARARLPDEALLCEGAAERLPFATASFDRVLSNNMFHYLREPLSALAEMKRVLRPGGELVITDWCDDYLTCRICHWYLRLTDRAHHRIYRQRDCRRLLERAGFQSIAIERYKINWLWGLMTAKAVTR